MISGRFAFLLIFARFPTFTLQFEGRRGQAALAKKFGGYAHIRIRFYESTKIDLEAGI